MTKRIRNAGTGRFMKKKVAEKLPANTWIVETVKPTKPKTKPKK